MQRIEELKEECPGSEVSEEWFDDRAVLSVIKDHRTVECDFVESDRSCALLHRTSEYYDVLGQGIMLGIIVPQSIVGAEEKRMKRVRDQSRFVILGYNEQGIVARA